MPRLTDTAGTSLPNIRDRFGEPNFRRFESAISHLVNQFPRSCIFNPGKLAQITSIARLRDAVRAYCHPDNTWVSAINRETLRTIWEQCSITPYGETQVAITSSASTANAELLEGLRASAPSGLSDIQIVNALDADLAQAVATCKAKGFFTDQITFVNLTSSLRDLISQTHPDTVWLDGDAENTYILL